MTDNDSKTPIVRLDEATWAHASDLAYEADMSVKEYVSWLILREVESLSELDIVPRGIDRMTTTESK